MSSWHTLDQGEVVQLLKTDRAGGLSEGQASERLLRSGPNELSVQRLKSPWRIIWEQCTSIMIVILLLAVLISAAFGSFKDAAVIFVMVLLNVIIGFSQEYQAERAVAALHRMSVPMVRVRRDGQPKDVAAQALVAGDIVLLEAGNIVPADGRVLDSANLQVQEAALTGESEPIEKITYALSDRNAPLGDRRNMMYRGTAVTYGRGVMVVTETGMASELGRIAQMLRATRSEATPLQKRLNMLGSVLAIISLALVAIIFALGVLRGEPLEIVFLTAVSIAIAAIPEGLSTVVIIALALGSRRMLKRRALIRRLTSVEALGSVNVICSDKTGTITENRMTVTRLDVIDRHVDLRKDGRIGRSELTKTSVEADRVVQEQPALAFLLMGMALCNDAILKPAASNADSFIPLGDPTETALVVAAAQQNLWQDTLQHTFPRVSEIPFASERKRMTTIHQLPAVRPPLARDVEPFWNWLTTQEEGSRLAFVKGALDSLLAVSRWVWVDDQPREVDSSRRDRILAAHDRLAQRGMRVIGLSFRVIGSGVEPGEARVEQDLIFVGLVGMIDPARPEVRDAVQICKVAGIRPVMITGDHPLTARSIASDVGIISNEEDRVLIGRDLEQLSPEELQAQVGTVSLYARVSPEQKLHIVQALQQSGQIVAMTGDGVNDAPALKRADVGVAMGITGTDVAREAADMVLLDDNFATIVAAVEEGRTIYDNLRKFVKYIVASNFCEILVVLFGPLLGMPLPLLPLQVLWINLATDGLPALTLGASQAERTVMRRPPYSQNAHFFSKEMIRYIVFIGLLIAVLSLGTGYWYWSQGDSNWQTIIFSSITFAQMFLALAIRSERDSFLRMDVSSNKLFISAILITCIAQLAIIYIPFLQGIFQTAPLSAGQLFVVLAISTIPLWCIEIEKALVRRRS